MRCSSADGCKRSISIFYCQEGLGRLEFEPESKPASRFGLWELFGLLAEFAGFDEERAEDSSSSFFKALALDDLIENIIMAVRNPIKTLGICYIIDKVSASGDEGLPGGGTGTGSGSGEGKSFCERLQSMSVTS